MSQLNMHKIWFSQCWLAKFHFVPDMSIGNKAIYRSAFPAQHKLCTHTDNKTVQYQLQAGWLSGCTLRSKLSVHKWPTTLSDITCFRTVISCYTNTLPSVRVAKNSSYLFLAVLNASTTSSQLSIPSTSYAYICSNILLLQRVRYSTRMSLTISGTRGHMTCWVILFTAFLNTIWSRGWCIQSVIAFIWSRRSSTERRY